MTSPVRRDARRYRRRILAICGVVVALGYVVTAPIFVRRVEADLEERVPDELEAAGFAGLTASFSGQDGTLGCASPLAEPEAARRAAYDVWGVRSIELDRSCRVNTGPSGADDEAAVTTSTVADVTVATTDEASQDATTSTVASTTVPVPPTFESVAAAVAGSPQLSLLSVLLQEAGLEAELADPTAEPVTLFAPTDAAFEALPADRLADLRSDPDTLRSLLVHHVAPGHIARADLTTGPLEMSDGTTVEIDAEAPSIDGVLITVTDIEATTGVVHIIDGVIAPEGLDLTDVAPTSPVDVTSADGTITLTGTVSTEAVRAMLTAAAGGDDVVVVDELVVDPLSGIDTSMAQGLVTLVEVLRTHLLDGSTGFDGEAWYLTGTLLTEADRPAVESAAAELDVVAELASPPDTAQDDASRLQEELDDFVTANPILFEPGSASITEGSQPVLDRIADLIAPVADVAITVEGHTDSDGSAQQNLVLSQLRALAVKRALVERGLPDESIDVEGFGSQQPILDADGVEDKEASRRVVFRVVPLS